MSMGAMVPTSTRVRLSRSVCRARSSEACATPRLKRAPTRVQYALRTCRIVVTTCWRSWTSEISRFLRCTSSCTRLPSMVRPRSSGCVTLSENEEKRRGLKLAKRLLDSRRDASHPIEYCVPVGST
jgi:hypothetical protein